MHLPKMEDRLKISLIIAEPLSISQDQLNYLLNFTKPDIQFGTAQILIGRTNLTCKQTLM